MKEAALEGDGRIEDNQRFVNVPLLERGGEEDGEGSGGVSFLEGFRCAGCDSKSIKDGLHQSCIKLVGARYRKLTHPLSFVFCVPGDALGTGVAASVPLLV